MAFWCLKCDFAFRARPRPSPPLLSTFSTVSPFVLSPILFAPTPFSPWTLPPLRPSPSPNRNRRFAADIVVSGGMFLSLMCSRGLQIQDWSTANARANARCCLFLRVFHSECSSPKTFSSHLLSTLSFLSWKQLLWFGSHYQEVLACAMQWVECSDCGFVTTGSILTEVDSFFTAREKS